MILAFARSHSIETKRRPSAERVRYKLFITKKHKKLNDYPLNLNLIVMKYEMWLVLEACTPRRRMQQLWLHLTEAKKQDFFKIYFPR